MLKNLTNKYESSLNADLLMKKLNNKYILNKVRLIQNVCHIKKFNTHISTYICVQKQYSIRISNTIRRVISGVQ